MTVTRKRPSSPSTPTNKQHEPAVKCPASCPDSQPSAVVFADAAIRHLIPEEKLSELLGLVYAREGFALNDTMAKTIGVRTFSRDDLCRYVSAHTTQLGDQIVVDETYVQWVASVLHCLYQLGSQASILPRGAGRMDNDIKTVKFVPLQSGARACLNDKLFFPFMNGQGMKGSTPAVQKSVVLFLAELPIIADGLTSCLSDIQNPVVLRTLRDSGVEPLSLQGVVYAHILPQFEAAEPVLSAKPPGMIAAYWSCIRLLHDEARSAGKRDLVLALQEHSGLLLPCQQRGAADPSLVPPHKSHFSQTFGNKQKAEVLDSSWYILPMRVLTLRWESLHPLHDCREIAWL